MSHCLEPRRGNLHGVIPNQQAGEIVDSGVVGLDGADRTTIDVSGNNGGAADRGAARICHSPSNRRSHFLREGAPAYGSERDNKR